MAGSISQQLEELLNPLPKFVDPEDDEEETTKAKVIEGFDEGDDEDDLAVSGLRKQATALLPETDRRYRGKAVSRKELQRELAGSGEEEDDDDDDDDDEDGDEVDEEAEEDEDVDEDDEEEEEDELGLNVQNGLSEIRASVSKVKRPGLTLPTVTDFQKLTEGMDDIGVSEDDEEEGDDDMEDSGEEDGESDEEEEDEEEEEEDAGAVMTFSKDKVDEEVEKGKAVKDQLALWDQLLEGRIKIQKALVTANQLPQQQTFPEFKRRGGAQFSGALKNSHKALKALQRSLLELQDQLLYQHPDTQPLSLGRPWGAQPEDEEIHSDEGEQDSVEEESPSGPPKRKLEMAEYPDFMAKRFAAFQPYRDATLQKWHDKTRLTMGKRSKSFGAFDRNILTQVEQVLMDKERLLRRTQTQRSEYRVLGRPEAAAPQPDPSGAAEVAEQPLKANSHLKDLDEEIFDDDDFYHQLLRELIERKTSAADPNDQVAMGRQWLAIQKLRSRIKKKVDTKASKGRRLRFHVHGKLVNFMAPMDHSAMNDEARTELYRSLFGKNSYGGDAVPE